MPEVRNRKTIFVKTTFGGGGYTGRFQFNFGTIGFNVDDIIINSWTCGGLLATVNTINMDGVGDLFSFTGQETCTPRNIFRVGRMLDGIQNFSIRDIDNGLNPGIAAGTLCFTIECIQFHI